MEIINFEWPDTDREELMKQEEKIIKQRAMDMIKKGKLDIYEYALYIERQMSLKELMEVVEKQIREDRLDELCELRLQAYD